MAIQHENPGTMQLVRTVAPGACLAMALLSCAVAPGNRQAEDTDWAFYGGDEGQSKYSPLDQIDRSNVNQLQLAWLWESPDTRIDELGLKDSNGASVTSSAFKSIPLVVDGTLYVRTSYSQVAAVNPTNGETLWVFDPKAYEHPVPANFGHSARGLALWKSTEGDRLVSVSSDGRITELDPQTGNLISGFGTAGTVNAGALVQMPDLSAADPSHYSFYPPPLVCGDTIIAGFTTARATPVELADPDTLSPNWPRGDIHGFDVRSGRHMWTFHTIPREGEFGAETWQHEGLQLAGKTSVWTAMSCDEDLGLAYLPVAGASENFIGIQRPGDNLFSQSLVALDARTGERQWHYQTVHHGLWDYDLVAAPTLMDINVNGQQIPALAQLNKNGFIFVLDRRTGQPIWPIEEKAVPPSTIPDERSAPTQPHPDRPAPVDIQAPLTGDKLNNLTPELARNAREVVAKLGVTPLFTPIGENPTLLLPGVGGGPNWGGAAYDPELQYLYVPSQTNPHAFAFRVFDRGSANYQRTLYGLKLTSPGSTLLRDLPITRPPYSRITAIDMRAGDHVWVAANGHGFNQHPELASLDLPALGSAGISGILATRTLVFSADANTYQTRGESFGMIRALDKNSGELLWEQELKHSYSGASPITYMAAGKQYIVIAIGGSANPGQWFPSYLAAFSLPDTLQDGDG